MLDSFLPGFIDAKSIWFKWKQEQYNTYFATEEGGKLIAWFSRLKSKG